MRDRRRDSGGGDGGGAGGGGRAPGKTTLTSRLAPRVQAKAAGPIAGGAAPVWQFDPPAMTFGPSTRAQGLTLTNATDRDQTPADWSLRGDPAFFVGLEPVSVAPGAALDVFVQHEPKVKDGAESALLVIEPPFDVFDDERPPATVNLIGLPSDEAAADPGSTGTCGTPIEATSAGGHPNSISSALISVGAAWQEVMSQQAGGVDVVQDLARKTDPPPERSGWNGVIDDIVAEGLTMAFGAVQSRIALGLAQATIQGLAPRTRDAIDTAAEAAGAASRLVMSLHKYVVGDVGKSIASQVSASVRAAISDAPDDGGTPAVIREAFFLGQKKTLAAAGTSATTALNNNEGDFAALEKEHPGLGFAALEAYRNHLACLAAEAAEIQTRRTLGMWGAFLASLELGVRQPEDWKDARPGADIEGDMFAKKDNHQRWKDAPARGVLDVHVIWDYAHKTNGIYQIKSATARGMNDDLKALLTTAPIREFPMPIIVHGQLMVETGGGSHARGQLRIGRNDGGEVFLAAEEGKEGDIMLQVWGDGDAYTGAARLLDHVGGYTLSSLD